MKTLSPDALQKQLERDLETINRYRELVARHGGQAPPGAQLSLPINRPKRLAKSIVGMCEGNLNEEWRDVDSFWEKVKAVKPRVERQVVATALRRLAASGVAEKRGDRSEGIEFRRKQA
jgi:hypothetical protein